MIERVLVLGAQRWDMVDEQTGERRAGTTLHYVSADYVENGQRRGAAPFRESGPVELYDQVAVVPGVYDVKFTTANKRDRNGRDLRTLKPDRADLVDEFDRGTLLQSERAAG